MKANPLPGPNPDEDARHGAILCTWQITLALKAISDTCYPTGDAAEKAALAEVIGRIDEFILRYSATTPAQLRRDKDQILGRTVADKSLCQGKGVNDALAFYEDLREPFEKNPEHVVDQMREELSESLAVPRAPTMDPCL